MSGTEGQAARATIGSLPPNPPQPVESEQAGQQTPEVAQSTEGTTQGETSTAPTQSEVGNLGAQMSAVDPLAFVNSIKTLVDLGTKVLGLVSKFPGPQQQTAQEVLKVLNSLDSFLGRL